MAETIRVHGLRELNKAFALVDKETKKGLRQELTAVAEPVRVTAETFAQQRISHIGPPRARSWARMRTGSTTKAVYVAPKQRTRATKRPKFARLLMERAMEPALERHEHDAVQRVENMLDRVADRNGF